MPTLRDDTNKVAQTRRRKRNRGKIKDSNSLTFTRQDVMRALSESLKPDRTHAGLDSGTPITSLDSKNEPFRIHLTRLLHLRDGDWHAIMVNPEEQGTWLQIDDKFVVEGNCKYTPWGIKVVPGTIESDPGRFALWLRAAHPPFLPKSQVIAQLIPIGDPPHELPSAGAAKAIGKNKPIVNCEVWVGDETLPIKGLLDMGADVMIVPTQN